MENCYFDIPVYISVWNYITVAGHQIHLKSYAQGALAEEMNSNESTCKKSTTWKGHNVFISWFTCTYLEYYLILNCIEQMEGYEMKKQAKFRWTELLEIQIHVTDWRYRL